MRVRVFLSRLDFDFITLSFLLSVCFVQTRDEQNGEDTTIRVFVFCAKRASSSSAFARAPSSLSLSLSRSKMSHYFNRKEGRFQNTRYLGCHQHPKLKKDIERGKRKRFSFLHYFESVRARFLVSNTHIYTYIRARNTHTHEHSARTRVKESNHERV